MRSYRIWLTNDDWEMLDFIVFRHRAKSRATAIRVCVKAMALHLGWAGEAFEAFEAQKGLNMYGKKIEGLRGDTGAVRSCVPNATPQGRAKTG